MTDDHDGTKRNMSDERRLYYTLVDDEGNEHRVPISERTAVEIGRAHTERRAYALGTSGNAEPTAVGEDGELIETSGPGELFGLEGDVETKG